MYLNFISLWSVSLKSFNKNCKFLFSYLVKEDSDDGSLGFPVIFDFTLLEIYFVNNKGYKFEICPAIWQEGSFLKKPNLRFAILLFTTSWQERRLYNSISKLYNSDTRDAHDELPSLSQWLHRCSNSSSTCLWAVRPEHGNHHDSPGSLRPLL